MDKRDIPAAGERYRHSKGELYQIVAVAKHSETGEEMVVYQALFGDFSVYVRPLSIFMSEAKREGYPERQQNSGLEKQADSYAVKIDSGNMPQQAPKTEEGKDQKRDSQTWLMEFLDADTYAQKLNILRGMKKHIDDKMVHDMAVCLDIGLNEKPLEEQIMDIESCLKTYARFECNRLR